MLNRSFIDDYQQGAAKVRVAIHNLTHEDLLCFPVPGTWSIQQIVLHIADADLVLADRMKRVIAEENPTLLAFDENLWTKNLHYHEQSADEAATMIELVREQMSRVLRALPDDAFARQGVHNQAGPLTLQVLVQKATGHLEHHLKFIIEKRGKLGK